MTGTIRLGGQTLQVQLPHCRPSSIQELMNSASGGVHDSCFPAFRFRGTLCRIRTYPDGRMAGVWQYCEEFRDVALDAPEAEKEIFAVSFEVRCKGHWLPVCACGSTRTGDVSCLAEDPQYLSGLTSQHTNYMWGPGIAELRSQHIEAVRLWLSDPIDMPLPHNA